MRTRVTRNWLYITGIIIAIIAVSCEKEDPVELPTLTTTEVTEITGNSVKSGGNIIDDGGDSITARGMVWNTSENPTVDNKDGSTSDGSGSGQFTSIISGLTPGKTYFVRAYAVNGAGTSYGNQVQFTTHDLATVITAEVTGITRNSAVIGGNITNDGGSAITAKGVVWGETENYNDGKTNDGEGTGEFTSELTELSPGTKYYARAYATNSEGTSFGNQISFTTEASERFLFLTSTVWTSDSLLANEVDASGTGQLLGEFKGDHVFYEDGTGNFGSYSGTWTLAQQETTLVITAESLSIPIKLMIIELTAVSLKLKTEFPSPANPQETMVIWMTFKPKQ